MPVSSIFAPRLQKMWIFSLDDDYAAYVLAKELGKPEAEFLLERSKRTPFTLWNEKTGFFEARNDDGSWAGEDRGWTEGDKWAYSFDVVHDIPQLIEKRGGNVGFVKSLEEHFNGGHNDHTNEVRSSLFKLELALNGLDSLRITFRISMHFPERPGKLKNVFERSHRTTTWTLPLVSRVYVDCSHAYWILPSYSIWLCFYQNEDCGQMSAWYLFTSLGFYPVNPVSGEYVIGSYVPHLFYQKIYWPTWFLPILIIAIGLFSIASTSNFHLHQAKYMGKILL